MRPHKMSRRAKLKLGMAGAGAIGLTALFNHVYSDPFLSRKSAKSLSAPVVLHPVITPNLLYKIRMLESSDHPLAMNPVTGATGVYQYLASSYLEDIYRYGAKLGYVDLSQKVKAVYHGPSGKVRYVVDGNWWDKFRVLSTRKDRTLSTELVQLRLDDNIRQMRRAIKGFKPTDFTVYLSHHFGAAGGSLMLKAPPQGYFRDLMPRACASNPVICFKNAAVRKNPRTVKETVDFLKARMDAIPAYSPQTRQSPIP